MTFSGLLDKFSKLKVLVVGDLMLDEYIFGKATRISPEAPVMVVRHQRTERLPGGAANVARNLLALGAEAHMVGVAGCDAGADLLETALREQGLTQFGLVRDPARATTRKTRVLADHTHQVLRIDEEDDEPLSSSLEDELFSQAVDRLGKVDVLVLSDYLKGALTPKLCSSLIQEAIRRSIPVIVNPKPRSLDQYRGATLISLNRVEATEAFGLHRSLTNEAAVAGARDLRSLFGVESLLITLGEAGMVAASAESEFKVDAPKVEVYDTGGAGDTVVATVALGIAAAGFEQSVFELAAQTSACVVRHVGVATPSAEDLLHLRTL